MSVPRRKACVPCFKSKVRCDQKRPFCARCIQRESQDQCTYAWPITQEQSNASQLTKTGAVQERAEDYAGELELSPIDVRPAVFQCSQNEKQGERRESESLNHSTQPNHQHSDTTILGPLEVLQNEIPVLFENLDLVCTVNSDEIRNRWLNAFAPPLDQTVKAYPPGVVVFVSRMLKSYTSMPSRQKVMPPFVHHLQQRSSDVPDSLANCFSLLKLCEGRLSASEPAIKRFFMQEMDRLYAQYESYDEANLVAAFQAYLIYSMTIFFEFRENESIGLHNAIVNLQKIASEVSLRGLVCAAELKGIRPKWESWVLAEAKRRTLFTMYLFDSVLCAHDNLPTFLAKELQGVLAPSQQNLWAAESRKSWNEHYNDFLSEWGSEGPLLIDELWPISMEASEVQVKARQIRIDKWLAAIDNYGTMLFAVTSCTHDA
ncbi:LAFA_0C10572g1_1 [Lachancea sp. 'fantastica']|nr:LAFA_0C10572g1_1 [Lachancea sp. 'fantastica']